MRSPYKLNKPFSKGKGLSNIFNNKEKNYELRTVYIITINYEQIMTIKTTICKLKVSFFDIFSYVVRFIQKNPCALFILMNSPGAWIFDCIFDIQAINVISDRPEDIQEVHLYTVMKPHR